MQWVDHNTYIGPCRRVAQRPHLQHRRRRNSALSSPPNPRVLLAQITFARYLGNEAARRTRTVMRIEAGLDLAERLGDRQMAEAFRLLRATETTRGGVWGQQ